MLTTAGRFYLHKLIVLSIDNVQSNFNEQVLLWDFTHNFPLHQNLFMLCDVCITHRAVRVVPNQFDCLLSVEHDLIVTLICTGLTSNRSQIVLIVLFKNKHLPSIKSEWRRHSSPRLSHLKVFASHSKVLTQKCSRLT